jgi:hypothetical protein
VRQPRYWLAGTLVAGCLAVAANAQIVSQVVNTVAVGGITGLGTGVATFLATPSSANLATAVTGETGSGALVFANSPTLDTLTLTGTTSAINGVTLDNAAWSTWAPTVSCDAGTITASTQSGRYKQIGKVIVAWFTIDITNIGTCTGSLRASAPIAMNTTPARTPGSGFNSTANVSLPLFGLSSANLLIFSFAVGPANAAYFGQVTYEAL